MLFLVIVVREAGLKPAIFGQFAKTNLLVQFYVAELSVSNFLNKKKHSYLYIFGPRSFMYQTFEKVIYLYGFALQSLVYQKNKKTKLLVQFWSQKLSVSKK